MRPIGLSNTSLKSELFVKLFGQKKIANHPQLGG